MRLDFVPDSHSLARPNIELEAAAEGREWYREVQPWHCGLDLVFKLALLFIPLPWSRDPWGL